MATTAQEIVRQALKKSGIIGEGQTPSSETLTDGLADLNDMVAQWVTDRLMVFHLEDLGFNADGRITPYTIGPGGNFNVARRPDRLDKAYLRQFTNNSNNLPVDTPLMVWESREQYSLATLKKDFKSYPSGVFLDPQWPLGNVYVYPWPNAAQGYELHLLFKGPYSGFPFTANTNVEVLPSHYLPAMKFALARRFRQAYGKGLKPDPELNALARQAISTVKNSNLAIPELQTDAALGGGGIYNIYSDGNS